MKHLFTSVHSIGSILLTLIPFYVEEKVVSLAAHNDHLDDPDEKEKILEDFNDMDEW